jgi:hypothetical protein
VARKVLLLLLLSVVPVVPAVLLFKSLALLGCSNNRSAASDQECQLKRQPAAWRGVPLHQGFHIVSGAAKPSESGARVAEQPAVGSRGKATAKATHVTSAAARSLSIARCSLTG